MEEKLKQYPLKLKQSLFDKIQASAKENGRSVNKEIIEAIKEYLRHRVI